MRRATRFSTRPVAILSIVGSVLALAACGSSGLQPMPSVDRGWNQTGMASWYGGEFHGRTTANGEVYDMYGLTAAHKTLPFDTLVEVQNLDNGTSVQVRINDRGPFVRGRIIDLTYAAAERIGMIGPGTARVRVHVVGETEVAGRRFAVQVGAFSDPAAARSLEHELGRGYPEVRVESDAGIHRVLVGSFEKGKKARKLERRLRSAGYDAFVRATVDG
jgi:rare lipoprotein A